MTDEEAQDHINSGLLEAQMEEYRSVRAEILTRVELQHRITNYLLLVVGAIITGAFARGLNDDFISRDFYFVLLVVPLILYPFALMYREQDFIIANLAKYVNTELRQRVARTTQVKDQSRVFGWDDFFRPKVWTVFSILRGNTRYYILFLPTILFVGLYVFLLSRPDVQDAHLRIHEWILISLNFLLLVDPLISTVVTTREYMRISGR